jgi:uncharacterized protein (UPF0218 family)
MFILPEEHRKLFQEPFGELYLNIDEILPIITGSIVYAVGVIDGYTMRLPCVRMPVYRGECIRVKNPAGSLTDDLIHALDYAVIHPPVTVLVDGEEDLAVIPLVMAAPVGAIVLYGQPHQGVVLRTVNPEAKKTARKLLSHFLRTDA